MLSSELRASVDALWDKFWSGGMANPLQAIDQMNHLIFLRRLEEISSDSADSNHALFRGADDCRWSRWSGMPADEMFDHVSHRVFPWMRNVAPENDAFTRYLEDTQLRIPKPSLLRAAVDAIDEWKITDRNLDTQGDIYEYMLGKLSTAGKMGQFRTPRHIIRMIVEMMQPSNRDVVVDPACGTGGFLVAAHQYMVGQWESSRLVTRPIWDRNGQDQPVTMPEGSVVGFDFDTTMVRTAAMNMVLHGIERPSVRYADALGDQFSHEPLATLVLANPPFAGSIDTSDISPNFEVPTRRTELLFVQLIQDLLVPGGRAAVIVPDGVLFGSSKTHKAIRKALVENNRIKAVISLPQGVFRPYSGVSTSIVIFEKASPGESVWMCELKADGFSLDDKREPIEHTAIPDLLSAWADPISSDFGFYVDLGEIALNDYDLSFDRYRPIDFSLPHPGEPVDLVDRMERTTREVLLDLERLRKRLDDKVG